MIRAIKKHPFAFLHFLGWLCMSISMAYVMHHENSDYSDVAYAEECMILFFAGLVLTALTPILGLIVKFIRRPDPATRRERSLLRASAKWYESTQPGFGWYYLLAVLAGVLPFLALFSVIWVDLYMPAVLLASIGLSIWLCFVCHEWSEDRLLQVTDTADRYHIQTDIASSLLDDLCEKDSAYGMTTAQWDSRRDHLYNMFLKEGMANDRAAITAYRFPMSRVIHHFGLSDPAPADDEMIWIPFSQFTYPQPCKGLNAIRKLFPERLTAIADQRYENNRSCDPADYSCASADIQLEPDETAVLSEMEGQLQLFAATATDPDTDLLYRGCMLRLEGAKVEGIKWDHFEDLENQEDDREDYLSPAEAQSFYRLLLAGAFTYEICFTTYLMDQKQIALEIWTEPEDQNGQPLEGEAASFVPDDGLGYLLILSYDQLRWHWMKASPMEPYHAFY